MVCSLAPFSVGCTASDSHDSSEHVADSGPVSGRADAAIDSSPPRHDDGQVPDASQLRTPVSDAAASATRVDAGSAPQLLPTAGALLGHFYGDGSLAVTDAPIGRKPSVHLTYYGWGDDWTQNDVPSQDLADGRIPLVNWEPDDVKFADIVSGQLDALIEARAKGSKALQKRLADDSYLH